MKHLKRVTAAKADIFTDIADFFGNLWKKITGFFKGDEE